MISEKAALSAAPDLAAPPRISVIIPAYNAASYITQALESVFQQDYDSYEIIVVDDGSTDETTDVLAPLAGRIRYCYQENAGSAAARNTGLQLAQGEFVVFLDADDLLLPGKFREQVACLDEKPALGFIHSGWRLVTQEGDFIKDVEPWHDADRLDLLAWLKVMPVKMGATMFRRAWLERIGRFDPTLRQSQDVDLYLRLALAGCQADWLRKPTLCYRRYPDSTVHNGPKQAYYASLVLEKFFARPDIPAAVRTEERLIRYYHSTWIVWHLFRTGYVTQTDEYLQKAYHFTPHSPVGTVFDWLGHFVGWAVEDGVNLQEVPALWPYLRRAAQVDVADWLPLERLLNWWLERWSLPGVWHYTELERIWPHFQAAIEAEPTVGLSAEVIFDWEVSIWLPYLQVNARQGAKALARQGEFSVQQLIDLVRFTLLWQSEHCRPAHIACFWRDAQVWGLVPPPRQRAVTALHLTLFGQALLARRWRAAGSGLWAALRQGVDGSALQAWWNFLKAGWIYFRRGRQTSAV